MDIQDFANLRILPIFLDIPALPPVCAVHSSSKECRQLVYTDSSLRHILVVVSPNGIYSLAPTLEMAECDGGILDTTTTPNRRISSSPDHYYIVLLSSLNVLESIPW